MLMGTRPRSRTVGNEEEMNLPKGPAKVVRRPVQPNKFPPSLRLPSTTTPNERPMMDRLIAGSAPAEVSILQKKLAELKAVKQAAQITIREEEESLPSSDDDDDEDEEEEDELKELEEKEKENADSPNLAGKFSEHYSFLQATAVPGARLEVLHSNNGKIAFATSPLLTSALLDLKMTASENTRGKKVGEMTTMELPPQIAID
eukprot:Trichotokara_eunicae@DN5958_c0_g1_i4.p1